MHNIMLKIELDGKPVAFATTGLSKPNLLTSSTCAEETPFDKASKIETDVLCALERAFADANLRVWAKMITGAMLNGVDCVHRDKPGVFDG